MYKRQTFLYRAAGAPAVSGSSFQDVPASAYCADAVAWAVKNGITQGTGAGAFSCLLYTSYCR